MQWFLFLFLLLLWSLEMELPATILEKLFFHKKAFIYVCNAFSWNTLSISSPPILPLSTNPFPSQCIPFHLLGKLFLNYVSFKLLKMFLKHSGIDWFHSSRQALYQLSHISSSACDFNLLFSPVCFWGEGPEKKRTQKSSVDARICLCMCTWRPKIGFVGVFLCHSPYYFCWGRSFH